jgi:hypothetical protein
MARMRTIGLLALLLGLSAPVRAQEDSLAAVADTTAGPRLHSPRKATILSAVVPGAGQIYNRKYWKAPIVWAGLGTCVWFIQDNHREYHRYRNAYLALVDDDPHTIDEFEGRYAPEQLRNVMDTYRQWRDLSYLITGLVYMLNIVDANVDAHFVRFDVSPDLSMSIGPALPVAAHGALGVSVQLGLK